MKNLYVLLFAGVLWLNLDAQTVNVTGYAFYDNKTSHDSIKVIFERTAPGAYYDSTYTNSSGYYSRNILSGIYNVHFKRAFYRTDTVIAINLFSSKNIDTALLENYQLIGNLKGVVNPGTYRVGGDIFVTKNDTLIIKPGVRLLFMPDFQFKIEGLILANGTITDSIIFSSYKKTTKWSGITVITKYCSAYKTKYKQNKLIFSYCLIEKSKSSGLTIYGINNSYPTSGSRFSIKDIILRDNSGNGLTLYNNDSSLIQNIKIVNNKGYGIYLRENKLNFNNLLVDNNGNNQLFHSCGIYFFRYFNYCKFENTVISNNIGTGIGCDNSPTISLINCKIIKNTFGGIQLGSQSKLTIINSIIAENIGYGIYSDGFSGSPKNQILIYNSTIAGNTNSGSNSDGIYLREYNYLNCSNSIIANNGKYGINIDSYNTTSNIVEISNTVIANNPSGIICNFTHPWLFKKIITNANRDSCDAYYNIFIDPKFVNTSNGDYRLSSSSPCIDVGVNDSVSVYSDIDGNVRVWDGNKDGKAIVDMGCYEFGSAIIYDLGKDISICSGDSAVLDAGPGYSSYNWNNGLSTNQKLVVKTAGNYSVIVKNSYGNEGKDSIKVFVNQKPAGFSIGNDSDICSGNNLILKAKTGFSSYQWNDNTTLVQKSITKSGNYYVTVTDSNGCKVNSDTVIITIHNLPVVILGKDTTFCEGGSKLLDAGKNFTKYIWSSKDTTQTLNITKSGNYFVKVTDLYGCEATSDTVIVKVNPLPIVKLRSDTAFCADKHVLIKANIGYAAYKWNTADTQSTITVNKTGDYFVFVTDLNGCSNYSDTVSVTVYPLPLVKLGNDQAFCEGKSTTLNAGSGFSKYKWSNNGSVNQHLMVTKAGHYYVFVTDQHQCSNYSDTVEITVYPLPVVNIGKDTSLCDGDVLVLKAGTQYNNYNWNNGSGNKHDFAVTKQGAYSVFVTDKNGCYDTSNTINVKYNSLPFISLGKDTTIYDNQYLTLKAGSGFKAYKWQNNSNDSFFIISGAQAGIGTHTYYVTVTDANNCSFTDTIIVIVKKFIGVAENGMIEFEVYPNPVENQIIFNCNEVGNFRFSICDLNGKIIKELTFNGPISNHSIYLSDCHSGVYLIKIVSDKKFGVKQLIKY